MSIDDESILSAYLDGQLSAEERRGVEAALASDPRLAEELRGLATVRDLIAGLSREADQVDVSARVSRRISSPSRSRWRAGWTSALDRAAAWRSEARAWPVARKRAVARLTAAAVFLLAGLAAFFDRVPPAPRAAGPAARNAGGALAAHNAASTHDRDRDPVADDEAGGPNRELVAASDANDDSAGSTATGPGAPVPVASMSADATAPSADQSRRPAVGRPGNLAEAARYLDNPDLRHLFFVDDSEDGSVQKRVASVIEETTRFHYYKITIAHGLVIDPSRPGEAAVFALVVDAGGLESLRGRLRATLNDRVHEKPADPQIAARLAKVDQVRAFAPHPVADVVIPRNKALAILAPEEGGPAPSAAETGAGAVGRAVRDHPTPEQYRSAPIEGPAQGEGVDRTAPALAAGPAEGRHSGRFVVLVWVSRAPRAG